MQKKQKTMYKIVFIRHGHSISNQQNLFTGWDDVDLSEQGVSEAHEYGQLLRKAGFKFDIAYTSLLKRAIRTLWLTLDELNQMWIPVVKDWRLNEKHSGALTGLNKAETAIKYGEEQVFKWINGYKNMPPLRLAENHEWFPCHDSSRYADVDKSRLPKAECLKDAVERVREYWDETISVDIRSGKQVLVVAHRNILRALIKHLDQLSDEEILLLNIPNGTPLVYELDAKLKPINHYYLQSD